MNKLLIVVLIIISTNIVFSQSSKPTFQIVSKNKNQTDNFIIVSSKIKSIFLDRGLVAKSQEKLTDEQVKADYNIVISIHTQTDSLYFKIDIIETCWDTIIASAKVVHKSENSDINELTLDLCDELFGTLMAYFEDMFNHGRTIKLKIESSKNLKVAINTKKQTVELSEILNEYISSKTIEKPLIMQRTDYEIVYKLKIPMMDDKNRSITALSFGDDLKKFLKQTTKLKSELTAISLFEIKLSL